MQITLDHVEHWIQQDEGENLEFKKAENQYDSVKLVRYCCALANEGGGYFILGVTDSKPREVVGSAAFLGSLEEKKFELLQKLRLRVDAFELFQTTGRRIVVFAVPSRPIGTPVKVDDVYWMRSGESLTAMTPERLKAIFDEAGPDFSAETCSKAEISDLDEKAVAIFRERWHRKSQNPAILQMPAEQLLNDAELVENGKPTYASLVLLGTCKALGRHLADAELVFEWRLKEGAIQADRRREFREGFFLFFDRLWTEVDARNQVHQYQDGLFRYDVPVFREKVVREAILNAVAHRDYRTTGSVFIRQWPTKMEIVSPGGFPEGITTENLLRRQKPRNRRIAETLARCGLVERSGQGADLMFAWSIQDGKSLPDFNKSDAYEVSLILDGEVKDEQFVRFLERLGQEKQISWGLDELWALSSIHTDGKVSKDLESAVRRLEELGAVERVGGRRLILSRRYYALLKRKGEYTRKRGLDQATNKALLLKHIVDNGSSGSIANEFQQVLPTLNRNQIHFLLRELKAENEIHMKGKNRGARWFPGPGSEP